MYLRLLLFESRWNTIYTNPSVKILYLVVEITQLLQKYSCTFNEAEKIIAILHDEIKQQREDLEFNTIDDFIMQIKTRIADDDPIVPINHVNGYF